MNDSRTWALVENLSNLDQMETRRVKSPRSSASDGDSLPSHLPDFLFPCRRNSDPVRKCLDLVESQKFPASGRDGESFAARGHQDLAQIAHLKRETLALLERPES